MSTIPEAYRALVEAGGPESESLRLHLEARARLIAEGPRPVPEVLPPAIPPRRMPDPGAGTYLKRWLGWARILPGARCGCDDLAEMMDRLGPDWCAAHRREILDAMRANARALGVPFVRPAAWALIARAIAKARSGEGES